MFYSLPFPRFINQQISLIGVFIKKQNKNNLYKNRRQLDYMTISVNYQDSKYLKLVERTFKSVILYRI